MRWPTLTHYLDSIKNRPHNNRDLGILFTGPVGEGKSTVAFQVLSYLDPEFGVDNCHFTIDVALPAAAATRKYRAWLLDEAHISGRKAMHGELQRLNDYLQICRGLNHYWGVCFHQDKRVDKPIMERVFVNMHIPHRGVLQIRVLKKNYETQKQPWRVVAAYRVAENHGAEWQRYDAKKDAHMRSVAHGDEPQRKTAADLGFNEQALAEGIQRMKEAITA